MTNEQKLETLLFWKGEPMSLDKISKILDIPKNDVEVALENLKNSLGGRGVTLVQKEDEVMLGTIPEASSMIEEITKEELSRDLGKAALETLAIVLYEGPVSRATIDYVRGVNSSFILRNLSIRGLVERVQNPNDARAYLYKPTFQLLSFLGISNISELPNFEEAKVKIAEFMSANTKDSDGED